MRFSDIFHMINGYVFIQAEGVFTERFLNICMHRNLDIWNIRHCGEERLIMNISIDSYKRIRQICRRTKTRALIIKRCGLPFFLHRYRKRRFVLIAAAAVLLVLWYTSGHIMGITVFGNNRIGTDKILENLARSGVALGRTTSNIDSQQIRNRMMTDIDDLAWIGINVSGSRVYVEVVERLEREKEIEFSEPCNLVAVKDGVIESVEARNGQSMVKKGSGVIEGDVLVSGIMDAGEGGIRYVHAYGEVYAETRYSITREYPLEYEEYIDTGKKTTHRTIRILNHEFPLYIKNGSPYEISREDKYEKEYKPPIDKLPSVFIKTQVYTEQYAEPQKRTSAEILAEKPAELEEELKKTLPEGAEVKNKEVENTLTERGTVSVKLTLCCRENIARESAIDTGGIEEPQNIGGGV